MQFMILLICPGHMTSLAHLSVPGAAFAMFHPFQLKRAPAARGPPSDRKKKKRKLNKQKKTEGTVLKELLE